ncbi:MAG: hypothetical protein KDA91_04440, partial [Planctomycetaceae bacterium]|nr:hypothetical protein [Planctomycetaceae bacterium]
PLKYLKSLTGLLADSPQLALRRFDRYRDQLQADFFTIASRSGKPRDLRWLKCEWQEERRLVRETESKLTTLLVGVSISFEAVEGGDMEEVEAVSDVRSASAVFHYRDGRWGTGGRVLFNLTPDAAVQRLTDAFTPLDQ